MKKMFGLFSVFMLIGTLSFAQETMKKTNCTPSPACAAAMGISLELCKKICKADKVSAVETTDEQAVEAKSVAQNTKLDVAQNVADVKLASNEEPRKPCCGIDCCNKKRSIFARLFSN